MMHINGNTGIWRYDIGLEIHAQISCPTKLFSKAQYVFGSTPNSCIALFDMAIPGTLPVLNEFCVKQAVKTALGLNAQINKVSIFDRKNYFYPDLPSGYQISQFYYPIASNGWIEIIVKGSKKRIKIDRIHMEQDAGKSIHDQSEYTLIDLNRAGVALLEIVSAPDIRSPKEAGEYVKMLRTMLRYLETCDGDMEKGSLRCDANISVRRIDSEELGTRCEIKNLNSIKDIIRAIEYEGQRQVEILEDSRLVSQETRLFDADIGQTRTMRSKEESHDYRYFPDPDLLPLVLEQEYIDSIKHNMPELPDVKITRYCSYGISLDDATLLTINPHVASYFEAVSDISDPQTSANWIISELFGLLNKYNIAVEECRIKPLQLSELIELINNDVISGKIAKFVFEEMFNTGKSPQTIINEQELTQISDYSTLLQVINEVVSENASTVDTYKSGKEKSFGFLVGQVMKKTNGKANPTMVNEMLKTELSKIL